jgi:ABC-2 type transport system permease protein
VGIKLDASGLIAASGALVPFALTFAAVGAVGTARWPRAAVGALGILVLLSYLLADAGPLLGWPAWVINLSVFQLYGTPLISGVNWNGLWALSGITIVGFGLAALLMQRREVSA